MKFVLISQENDLIVMNDVFTLSSVSIRFFKNLLKGKEFNLIFLNFNILKSKALLKLIEFCKFKQIEEKKNYSLSITSKSKLHEFPLNSELYFEQWPKNFIKIDIVSLIDLYIAGYLLGIEELIELTLYGIAIVFLKRVNQLHFSAFLGINEDLNFNF